MTDHDRRNLTCIVRMHRQLGMELPDHLLEDLDAAGIEPGAIEDDQPGAVGASGTSDA